MLAFDDFASRWVEVCARCREEHPEAGEDLCVFCNLNDTRDEQDPPEGDDDGRRPTTH